MKLEAPWEQINQKLLSLFTRSGIRVKRSFDLKLARQGLKDPGACTCPHHGTNNCSCQYMVYLLYDKNPEPLTLVLHGHDQWTQLSIEPRQNGYDDQDGLYEYVSQLLTQQGIA